MVEEGERRRGRGRRRIVRYCSMEFGNAQGLGKGEFSCGSFSPDSSFLLLLLGLFPTYAYFTDIFVARHTFHITSSFYKEQLHGMRIHSWSYEHIYIMTLNTTYLFAYTSPPHWNLNCAKRAIKRGELDLYINGCIIKKNTQKSTATARFHEEVCTINLHPKIIEISKNRGFEGHQWVF